MAAGFALALAALVLALRGASQPLASPSDPGAAPAVSPDYGELPLAFAPGAAGGPAFAASSEAGSIALGRRGALISPAARGAEPIRMSLVGGALAEPRALGRLPGVVNDLRGDDPSRWRAGVPTFERVRYAGVYPGTALDFHGTTGTLEYDFRLAPGADPDLIAVDFNGAALRLTDRGALVAGTGPGRVRQAPPIAFQPSADGRDPVRSRFVLRGDRVGFAVGDYDRSRPLVIDPLVLSYSTFLGGSDSDFVGGVAVDSDGAAYVTGYTASTNFPTSVGAPDTSLAGTTDVIVTKINPAGSALVYSTLIGGGGIDFGTDIAVDGSGSAYVTGQSSSTGPSVTNKYPTVGGGFTTFHDDRQGDIFVTKLNPAGTALSYSALFGGSRDEESQTIAVDAAGNAYFGGDTASRNDPNSSPPAIALPTSQGAYQSAFGGNRDGFVGKLDTAGGLAYLTYLGGTGQDEVAGIDVDSQGRAYVTGFAAAFSGNNFPTTVNRYAQMDVNGTDAFLTRLSANGATLEYSTAIGVDGPGGNEGSDYGNDVAVGATDGIAYIVGSSRTGGTTDFPLKNEYEGRSGACCYGLDAFAAKFDTNSSGESSLLYSTLLSGGGEEAATAVDVDPGGNAYVGGTVSTRGSADPYDTTPDEIGGGAGRGTAFVTKVVQSGSADATLGFSTTIPNGGFNGDGVTGVALDPDGDVYVSGTSSGNAPVQTTAGAFQPSHPGGWDGFISKISTSSEPVDTVPPATTITSGPSAGSTVTSSQVTFGFSSNEAGSTFECRYDGGAFAPCTSPGPGASGGHTQTLAEGTHTFEVRARDAAGNPDPTPESRTFAVDLPTPPPPPPPPDRTPPATTITKAPRKLVKVRELPATVSVGFASNEPGSTFTCRLDDGPARSCSSPAAFALGKGPHTIAIAARDRAGNVDASPATAKVRVKKKRPKKGGR